VTDVGPGPELDRILARCLAFKPKDRYPSARELLVDLEKWKPKPARPSRSASEASAPDQSKAALGDFTPADAEKAEKMAKEAVRLARSLGNVAEAADLMERALNEWPGLRDRYEKMLKNWRRGVVM
jgi:hypothetical protein